MTSAVLGAQRLLCFELPGCRASSFAGDGIVRAEMRSLVQGAAGQLPGGEQEPGLLSPIKRSSSLLGFSLCIMLGWR